MVNIKVPLNPVQKRGLWPPKGAREYPVLDTDDWWKVAAREHLDVWALIEFNFQTHVPEEVNWYLAWNSSVAGTARTGAITRFSGPIRRSAKSTFRSRPLPRVRRRRSSSHGTSRSKSSDTKWSIRPIRNGTGSCACSTRWRTVVTIAYFLAGHRPRRILGRRAIFH